MIRSAMKIIVFALLAVSLNCPAQTVMHGPFKVSGHVSLTHGDGCGPPLYNCSTQSTLAAPTVTQPTLAINQTGYSYSSPTDFYYPKSGKGNCITRLTDANSHIRSGQSTGDMFAPSWGGGGNDLMSDIDRDYMAVQSVEAGATIYMHVSYDANGCMHNDTPVLSTNSLGGSGGGFSASKTTHATFYHLDTSTGTKTTLMQETVTGTSTITFASRVAIFDFNRCPGLAGVNGTNGSNTSQGGNSALTISSDDRYYGTGLNFPPSISGQGGAHWIVVWDRTLNKCATWYTGQVSSAENPDGGNIYGWCDVSGTNDCSHSGNHALPIANNTECVSGGWGIHGVQMAHNAEYINASGTCNGVANDNSSTKWQIGVNNLSTCRGTAVPGDPDYFNCGGHGSAGYSTFYYSNQTVTARPMSDISAWTTIHGNMLSDFHGSEHWIGAAADTNPWLVSTLKDPPGVFCPTEAYCFELIAIRHDGVIPRFTPNFHIIYNTNDLGPISVMTPDGYCMIWNSSWNDTLGAGISGQPRKDMFSICNLQ